MVDQIYGNKPEKGRLKCINTINFFLARDCDGKIGISLICSFFVENYIIWL